MSLSREKPNEDIEFIYKLQAETTKSLGRNTGQGVNPCKVLRVKPGKSEHSISTSVVMIEECVLFFQQCSASRESPPLVLMET